MSTVNLQEDGKVRRPPDTGLHQQTLNAWKPVMNAQAVIPHFLVWGLLTLPLGVVIVVLSANVQQFSYDYTYCTPASWPSGGYNRSWSINGTNTTSTYRTCADWVADQNVVASFDASCKCTINFTLSQAISGPVYLYYGLTNFYQSHRRIWRSRDDVQLNGQIQPTLWQFCSLTTGSPGNYAPCGALANAMWNDSFTTLTQLVGSAFSNVSLLRNGIVSYYDTLRYENAYAPNGTIMLAANAMQPPNWPVAVSNLGYSQATSWQTVNGTLQLVTDLTQVGYQYQQFINWMHTSALATFQKLTARVDPSAFPNGLPAGLYQMTITYAYPVTKFGGTKQFILATNSWLGGGFPLLGFLLIIVGCIYFIVAIAFVIINFQMANSLITKYGLDHEDLDPDAEIN